MIEIMSAEKIHKYLMKEQNANILKTFNNLEVRLLVNIRYARLTETQLKKVQALEKELNVYLLAVEKAPTIASLSKEDLAKIQKLEKELGLILVAYK